MISGLLVVVVELLLLVAASTVAITTPQPAAASAGPLGPSETTGNSGTGARLQMPGQPAAVAGENATSTLAANLTSPTLELQDAIMGKMPEGGSQKNSDSSKKEKANQQKASKHQSQQPIYTNQFVIEVKGGEEEARKLAHKHGFVYLNHILGDFYHLEHKRLSKRSLNLEDAAGLDISIQDEPQVLLLERQVLKRRVKRDFLELPERQPAPGPANLGRAQQHSNFRPPPAGNQRPVQVLRPPGRPAHHQFTRPANQLPNAGARAPAARPAGARLNQATFQQVPGPAEQETLEAAASSSAGQQQVVAPAGGKQRPTLNSSPTTQTTTNQSLPDRPFNDPSWPLMWYLDGGAKNGFDLNVLAAWKMGYTGKGIVITILDDGLEKDHPDLEANYDPLASFDINGDDADPMPRYDANDSNRHGTRCAGEVAAVPDNNICSIGIAYNSKVGGVRMLDGDVTDAVEARSLGLNNQHIHIYSASWGPDDNGKTVDGPGDLATRAFMEGVTNGRQGLGSIFVFASGNGGREHDNCNCDGYTNSIWTLSISSATENGYVPWYIEACSSTLATTYSSGSYEERQIATTDLHHTCTSSHTGTSASAPLAAGICALVLESNPRLSWRDMQHIVVKTAKPANLIAKDWRTNALGRNVSHAFGYGLMDAGAMILMAKRWTTVPKQYTCEVRSPQMDLLIRPKGYVELKLRAECANVRFLEHVQSKVTLTAARRGDLHIYLVSPHGTRSTLLAQRPNDLAEQGFRNWPFMTVHSWGESPNGNWTLEVHNDGKPQNRAFLKEMTLILYGTYDDPNRHLVDGAIGAPSGRPAPPVHAASQRPSPKPAPPAPMPPFLEQPARPEQHPAPSQALDQGQGRPAWVISPPPPPPSRPAPAITTPAPPSSTGSSASSSTSSSSSTSTSSYVTTFKTIVSSSAGRPPAKADFEIVSAPARPPAEPTLGDVTGSGSGGAPMAPPPMKPPVSGAADMMLPPLVQTINQTLGEPTLARPKEEPAPELEGNQIDLKLSKDYRSSGDHYAASGDRLLAAPDLSPSSSAAPAQQTGSGSTSINQAAGSSAATSGRSAPPQQVAGLLLLALLCAGATVSARRKLVLTIR